MTRQERQQFTLGVPSTNAVYLATVAPLILAGALFFVIPGLYVWRILNVLWPLALILVVYPRVFSATISVGEKTVSIRRHGLLARPVLIGLSQVSSVRVERRSNPVLVVEYGASKLVVGPWDAWPRKGRLAVLDEVTRVLAQRARSA